MKIYFECETPTHYIFGVRPEELFENVGPYNFDVTLPVVTITSRNKWTDVREVFQFAVRRDEAIETARKKIEACAPFPGMELDTEDLKSVKTGSKSSLILTPIDEELSRFLTDWFDHRISKSLVLVAGVKLHPRKGEPMLFPPNTFGTGFLVRYRGRHFVMTCGHTSYDRRTLDKDAEWTWFVCPPETTVHSEAGREQDGLSLGKSEFLCSRPLLQGEITPRTTDVGWLELPRPEQLLNYNRNFFDLDDSDSHLDLGRLLSRETVLAVLGFPGVHRATWGEPLSNGLLSPAISLRDTLVGCSDYQDEGQVFSARVDFTNSDNPNQVAKLLTSSMFGMSGGPCFLLDRATSQLRLVGIQVAQVACIGLPLRVYCQHIRVWKREVDRLSHSGEGLGVS